MVVSPARVSMVWIVRRSGPPDQAALDAPMLVAERNLQVQHLFAVALEPKMPGLDDARMHRPDGNFVYLFAFHLEEVSHPDLTGWRGRVRIHAASVRSMESDGLEPRMIKWA